MKYLSSKKNLVICGIDEAGRGPLAGPVVAAAVLFEAGNVMPEGLRDSKKLTAAQREELFDVIGLTCLGHSTGIADHEEIDKHNILAATMFAMHRALIALKIQPDVVLVDGNYFRLPGGLEKKLNFSTVVKGDDKVPEISCASVIAKVTRDRIMCDYDALFPEYGFAGHKGYPTFKHIQKIREFGICEIHRKTFCGKFINSNQCDDEQVRIQEQAGGGR